MTIQPQTTFAGLLEELHELQEMGRLLPYDSEAAVSLSDRIEKLRGASEPESLLLQGLWQMLCGNAENAITSLSLVEDTRYDPDFQKFCVFVNLGYASRGLESYRIVGSPLSGQFTHSVFGGIAAGAVRTTAAFINQAKGLRLSNLDGIPVDTLLQAGKIFEEYDISDDDVAKVLDVSGSVIREHGLLHLGDVLVDASELSGKVVLRFRLAVSPDQAVWLYDQFLDRLYDEELSMPRGLVIAYEGDAAEHIPNAGHHILTSSEIRV